MKKIALLIVIAFLVFLPSSVSPLRAETNAITNPILFVTQVPIPFDYTTVGSTIGNQAGDLDAVYRGGDLWIRYPDGTLKNLTQAAGYGSTGANGFQDQNAIAVRDPAMHWNGTKAIFSMVVGAATAQYQYNSYYWQLYEITGLGKNETPVITKVPNQPAQYNNISPAYGTDDRILFTSDRPRNGASWLYPQLDEYESAATVTGIWSLNPSSGDLFLLNHAVSGAFTPFVDSFGRVIFTRWDHLQRDQQADTDYDENSPFSPQNGCPAYCTFNYANESQAAQRIASRDEVFPEPRSSRTDLLQGTNLVGHGFNDFAPWQINEDGTQEETLNHIGRHELLGYIEPSFNDDPALDYYYGQYARTNPNRLENFLQIEQDPTDANRYFGIDAPEFYTHGAGQVVSMTGAPTVNADQMTVTYWTHRDTSSFSSNPSANFTGHYRDILPLASGTLVAAVSAYPDSDYNAGSNAAPKSKYDFRLKTLKQLPNAYWAGDQPLTGGISKTISWWSPDIMRTYSGELWEWEAVEVRARARPQRIVPALSPIEQGIFDQAGVSLAAVQQYLRTNNLALMVSRNVTQRDDFDLQQPFNLRVPNGVQTLSKNFQSGDKIYDVRFLQLFQGDQVRGMGGTVNPYAGRRVISQYMHDAAALAANPPANGAPQSSVAIAADGSAAAFVPARRAMTWQITDNSGTGVVRERMWITFQPGEVRVCSSCHGANDKDQAGHVAATNPPQALLQVLQYWKANNGSGSTPTSTATATRTATRTATKTATRTRTITATRTASRTGTSTRTTTATRTVSRTPTKTPTGTATATRTLTSKPTRTRTATATVTATGTPTRLSTPDCSVKPAAPNLTAPGNGEDVSTRRVQLDWDDMRCVSRYIVIVRSGSPQGSPAQRDNNVSASEFKTKRLDAATYFWRVKACGDFGCKKSGWSSFIRP